MELLKEFSERVRAKIESKIGELPQETRKNHMMGGKGGFLVPNHCFYNPHNYRLYLDFNKATFDPLKPWSDPWFKLKQINSTEYILKLEDFNIRVKKYQIEIQNKVNDWHRVPIGVKSKDKIIEILHKKDVECLIILNQFINAYGGRTSWNILRRKSEDKIEGEEKINLIAKEIRFHNEVVKKVYNEKTENPNVEFKNPVYASNYLYNRGVEAIAPELTRAIYTLNPLRAIKQCCGSIQDIIEMKDFIKLLTKSEQKNLNKWAFREFSI